MEENARPLRVVLVNHSDTLGGASIVTSRLLEALRDRGVDARLIVYTQTQRDVSYITKLSTRYRRALKFVAERAVIYMRNGFNRDNLFKVSIANTGTWLHRHPWIKEADIIVLNWINQGMLSLNGLKRLGRLNKPIVWTLHDMWCLTGICHHALECENYKQECGQCQFLTGRSSTDLSHSIWKKKQRVYDRVPIHWVPVSNWLADCCRQSSLLRNRPTTVIPNVFPTESFFTDSWVERSTLGLPREGRLILFGAARIDNPIKGINYAIDALNYLFDNDPELSSNTTVVFFGAIRHRALLDRLRFPHVHLGRVSDPMRLRRLYASADVVLSTSLYETLPGTLIEGLAAGCLPVTFDRGGQRDIVDHLKNGYIARYKDIEDVAAGIVWALNQNVDREALHRDIDRRFGPDTVATRYIDLFNQLVKEHRR